MPIVNIPEVGRVRFPDDMAEADISREANGLYLQRQQQNARAAGEQPTSSKGLDALSRLPEGMATGTARTLQGAARVADIAGDTPPIPFMGGIGMDRAARVQSDINRQITAGNLQRAATRQQRVEESPLYQFGAQTTEAAQDFYGVDRRRDDEFVAQLATAAGEMVPTLTAGALAGPLGAGAQYSLNAGESQAQEAIAAGKPEAADVAFLAAAGLGGITEAALGVPGRLLTIANRARKAGVNPSTFGRWANRNPMAAGIARAGAEGALREGAQEGLEQAGQNLIASDVAGYDPDRPVGQGVGRAAALGATLGGLVGGGAAGVNQANRNQLAADLRAARGQRIVGYTSEGQPIPAADAVPDPLADLRGMANPTADAPATPGTTVLPDGRVVLVNQQTGTTEFPPQAESQPLKVESPEAAPLSTFNLQPSTPLSPATPPTGAAPAPTAEVAPPVLSPPAPSTFNLQPSTLPDVPGVPPPLEGQPYEPGPLQRPEAAMETRRAAELNLQREPAVSPELADAIAAVRGGYNPEVEAAAEQNRVALARQRIADGTKRIGDESRPPMFPKSVSGTRVDNFVANMSALQAGKAKQALSKNIQSGGKVTTLSALVESRVANGATVEREEEVDTAARNKLQAEYNRTKGTHPFGNQNHPETIRFNKVKAELQAGGPKVTVRRLVNADGETFLSEKSIGKTAMDYAEHLLAKPDSPTPPDQSGAPTELTPGRVQVDPKTDELLGTNSRGEPIYWSANAKTHYAIANGRIATAPWVEGLPESALTRLDNLLSQPAPPPSAPADLGAGAASPKPKGGPAKLTPPAKAAVDELSKLRQQAKELDAKIQKSKSGTEANRKRLAEWMRLTAQIAKLETGQTAAATVKPAEVPIEIGDTALYVDPSRPNKPPVKVAISSIRQLPNDAEMMAEFDYFGPKRVPVSKLKLHDKSQAFKMREMAKQNKAADAATRAQQTPAPAQSGAPTELTPPAKGTAEPLSPTEVSEFNALEQARRAGTLDAAGATRYRELETRAGQGDLLMPAPPPLTPANVPTAAKVTPAQASQAANPKTEFNAKVAKEQKKFLLDAVDKALAEAPDTSPQEIQALWRASEHFAAKQKLEDYTKANPYPTAPNRYNFGYTDEELAKYQAAQEEFQKAQQEWQARRDAELQAVAEPYLAEMIGGADVNAALTEGTELAFYRSLPHVTIEVPGDGVFSIINTKDAIREFKERAAKFPTTAARAKAPTQARTGPSPVPALGELTKENVLKAAALAMSTDPSRAIINTVWSDGQQTVATDGRRMHWFAKGIGGTVKKPAIVDAKGKPVTNLDRDYPNWQQVRPDKAEMEVVFTGQDAGKLWTVLKQAQQMVEEKNNSIMLWWNRDRTLGISSASPDAGTYEHNVKPKAKIMTALDPQYVMDALAAARGTGSERVDILWNDDMSPVVIQAPGFEAVIMPMRLSGPSPIFDPEMLTRYDLAATPETRRAMMKKDLAAIQRLGRPTGTEEVKAKWLKEQLGEVEDFAAEIARLEAKRKKEAAKPRTTAQKAAAQQRINAELQAEIDRLKALQNASSPGGVSTGTEGAQFTASAAYPGGALGTSAAPQPPPPTGSIPPAQDREHSVFPLELPELVRLARMLGQGHFPKLKNALRGGKALGVFRYREGKPDSGRIELVRGLWQMVLPEEKAELQRKAEAYAAAMVDQTDAAERARVAKAKYEADLETLMDERLKQDPIMAVKVLAHEIGHWIDFLPQAMISGRGNLFGHVASLKKFLRHTITWDPKFAELNETGELTEADRRRLREAARRELEKELGPIREIIEKVLIEEPVFATTGVTPEDVKRLFGMDARETMPELYLWFAGLNAATKKEVVKAAMRGMVDARVPASRVQTGTRTVEREVRKVSGRMPTPEEIAARFQAKLREAMEARRTMDINEVKAQLREAITWWRGAKQFEEYFASPEEMYAEAFSIFLANPAALAQRAPKYFNALLNYMDRKPEAAKAYGDLQLAIRQGTLQQQRDKDLLAGFAKDEQRFRDRADLRKPPMDWVDNLVYHMDRRLGPIYRRARGSKLEGTIRGALGDFNYRGAEHERFLSAINREVSEPLVAENLEWSDLGYYMFHKRVVEHFDQKAVPLGYSPHSSQKALDAKQAELGPARWAALEQAQRQFMALYQSQVVPLLKTSGLTTPELQKLIEDRVFYATFKAVKDDPKDDIERLLTQAYGSGVGSHIYRRVGNLGEVANPATATLMKALSLMSAAYRNNAKRHLPAMLEEMGLPVREVEKTWDKNLNALTYDTTPLGAASPVQKLVFMEDGKPKAYYVEASIAEAFNSGDPIENNLLLGVLAASRGMKRLFTDINYGFWPFAFVRDVAGFGMQMPGLLAPVRYFKNLPKAFAASRDSLKGKPNPLADEALKRKMWISQADPYGVRDAAENEAELQIAAHGLTPASWKRGGYRAKFAAAWEWYRNWGKVLERTHKLNGMLYLDQHYADLPEWQKQEMVREWAGSPDFLQQPGDRRWINALALFYNPWKESLRSVAKAAKHHPGEFAAKATLGILMPTVLQSLAVMGLLGDDLEEMYKSVGDYDLTNYLIFPLGWEDKAQGKVKYLRFPLWEPARMAHGLLFGQITGRGEKPLSHAGGQVPGLNPLLTATAAWMDYKLRGRNPYDSHYGREILDPDVFKVGGTAADAAMLKWTWNQLGGSVLFRFDTRPELIKNDTPLEKSLKAPGVSNLVGRFLRVSNRGILDADRKVIEPGEQQRARVRLAVDEVKAKLLRNEALAQSEHLLLSVDPYARDYLLRTLPEDYLKRQSLLYQRLQRAPNNEAKVKLLTETRGGGWVSD